MTDDHRPAAADAAARDAGMAYRRGEFSEALQLLADAQVLDPGRAGLWAERETRVREAGIQAARSQHTDGGGLAAELARRQEAAGITRDDLARIADWNRLMFARAGMQYPPPQMEAGQ